MSRRIEPVMIWTCWKGIYIPRDHSCYHWRSSVSDEWSLVISAAVTKIVTGIDSAALTFSFFSFCSRTMTVRLWMKRRRGHGIPFQPLCFLSIFLCGWNVSMPSHIPVIHSVHTLICYQSFHPCEPKKNDRDDRDKHASSTGFHVFTAIIRMESWKL